MADKKAEQNIDLELVRAFKNGDVSGYNRIVLKYQEQVYWVARKMVNDHDDANDLTQEVFIKVYSALKDFREESNLFTWLYRITMNFCLNHVTKPKTKMTVSVEEVVEPMFSSDQSADERIDEEIRREAIMEAIETLPKQQRAVFNMRYYDNIPYEEISKIMKRSVGGVKANYFHAVKHIGNHLKEKLGITSL